MLAWALTDNPAAGIGSDTASEKVAAAVPANGGWKILWLVVLVGLGAVLGGFGGWFGGAVAGGCYDADDDIQKEKPLF